MNCVINFSVINLRLFMFTIANIYSSQKLYENALIPQDEFSICSVFLLGFIACCALYSLILNKQQLFLVFLIFFTVFATVYLQTIPEEFRIKHKVLYTNCQYTVFVMWVLTLSFIGFTLYKNKSQT